MRATWAPSLEPAVHRPPHAAGNQHPPCVRPCPREGVEPGCVRPSAIGGGQVGECPTFHETTPTARSWKPFSDVAGTIDHDQQA